MKTIRMPVFAAALVLALGACDSATGTSGDGDATLQIAARGDDAPATQRSPESGARFTHGSASGTVDFTARVYVQTSAGGWTEVTGAEQATVDASGHGSAVVLANARVEADSYARVRVVFEEVEAHMNGSLQVSTGLLTGDVRVQLGADNGVTVERQVNATVTAGGTTRLLINLNAGAWLNQASATTRTVSEAAFAAAVQVTAS